MKKHFHKMATYTALVLISSLPFAGDIFADAERNENQSTLSSIDKSNLAIKRKNLSEKE